MAKDASQLQAEAALLEDAALAGASRLSHALDISGRAGLGSQQNLGELQSALDQAEVLVGKIEALLAVARELNTLA